MPAFKVAAASANDHNQARHRRGAAAAAAGTSWAAAVLGAALLPPLQLLLLLLAGTATADTAIGVPRTMKTDAAVSVPLPHAAVEELFKSCLNAETARRNLWTLTSVPHQAGSVGDFQLAKVRYKAVVLIERCKQQTPSDPNPTSTTLIYDI